MRMNALETQVTESRAWKCETITGRALATMVWSSATRKRESWRWDVEGSHWGIVSVHASMGACILSVAVHGRKLTSSTPKPSTHEHAYEGKPEFRTVEDRGGCRGTRRRCTRCSVVMRMPSNIAVLLLTLAA